MKTTHTIKLSFNNEDDFMEMTKELDNAFNYFHTDSSEFDELDKDPEWFKGEGYYRETKVTDVYELICLVEYVFNDKG